MGYDGVMIIFSLIVILVAMAFGYLVALTHSTSPTLGDVLFVTAFRSHYGFMALLIILFVWWATS